MLILNCEREAQCTPRYTPLYKFTLYVPFEEIWLQLHSSYPHPCLTDFSSISINPDSSLVDGAFTHKEGATSVIIQITVDAFPFPMPTLTKLSENENITVDSSRVFINNSEIQFLAPLNRLDAGLYTLMMTNLVDTLMESFTIDVHCKLIN